MKLEFTEDALDDLLNMRDYIAGNLKNPMAAERLMRDVVDGCQQLKRFPHMGRALPEMDGNKPKHRMLVVRNQVVIYIVREDAVRISRVIDGRTDYMKVLFKDIYADISNE